MGTASYLKICPLCHTGNEPNAIICCHCGAHIELRPNIETTRLADENPMDPNVEQMRGGVDLSSGGLAFFLLSRGEPVALRTEAEFLLGRAGEMISESLLDLTECDGFAMGISRRHAMVRATGRGYEVIDLNSSNGTWINGQRLVPNKPYDLPNGAVLQVGRLKLITSYLQVPVASPT